MISRLFHGTLLRQRCVNSAKCWFGGEHRKNVGNLHQFHSTVEPMLSNPWFQRIASHIGVRVVAGGVFFWCSSTLMILSYADFMRYRRTVNSFYTKRGRIADTVVDRATQEKSILETITDSSAMGVFYGKNGAGKSYMVSNVCDNTDEPIMYIEIRNRDQFMKEFVKKIRYYQNEDLTLRNYFKWIIPRFALGRQEKAAVTVEDVIIHLTQCEEWLERVQKYPWYVLYSVVKYV